MGHIDWKSFALGVFAYWAWKYVAAMFMAKAG
jgi:hypothetical protein